MRLFVAAYPNDLTTALELRRRLEELQHPALRLVPPENLHVTLQFLGEVPDASVPQVAGAYSRAFAGQRPIRIAVGDCGCFPARGAPRVVWSGVSDLDGDLARCLRIVAGAYSETTGGEEEGQHENQAFSPHITVARVSPRGNPQGLRASLGPIRIPSKETAVGRLALVRSELTSAGARYVALVEQRL